MNKPSELKALHTLGLWINGRGRTRRARAWAT